MKKRFIALLLVLVLCWNLAPSTINVFGRNIVLKNSGASPVDMAGSPMNDDFFTSENIGIVEQIVKCNSDYSEDDYVVINMDNDMVCYVQHMNRNKIIIYSPYDLTDAIFYFNDDYEQPRIVTQTNYIAEVQFKNELPLKNFVLTINKFDSDKQENLILQRKIRIDLSNFKEMYLTNEPVCINDELFISSRIPIDKFEINGIEYKTMESFESGSAKYCYKEKINLEPGEYICKVLNEEYIIYVRAS